MLKSELSVLQTKGTGRGVFTLSEIAEGESVFIFEGEEKWAWEIEEDKLQRCLQVAIDRYIVPHENSFGWYLNHSCNPNCYVKGKNSIKAIRKISAHEEVTIDYSFNVTWKDFRMKCNCNALNCRGVIKNYFSLPESIRSKFRRYTSEYLLKI